MPALPSKVFRLGAVDVSWEETDPGVALIKVLGGTADDRAVALYVTRVSLAECGYEAAQFEITGSVTKQSHWDDIMAKAKRLIDSGQVQVLRNHRNMVVGHVIGDHGEYNCEFSRDDPNSWTITGWQCECPWDQYAWQRTRKWKKYEGRVCSHVLATFWQARRTPVDEDYDPSEHGPLPKGQMGPAPSAPPGAPPGPPAGQLDLDAAGYAPPPLPSPQQTPAPSPAPAPAPAPAGMAPPGSGVIPPQPMLPGFGVDQLQLPIPGTTPGGGISQPNAVSVPGAKVPDPFNPVQNAGGTFSHVAAAEFTPDMQVRLDKPHMGILEGKSEEHGAGQYMEIPQNEIGTVMGEDELPVLGKVVEVIFAGPCRNNGPMEPYHVRAFIPASDLTVAGWVKAPGPFIKRR
ncbi:hypothetical protein [Candidatus Solirubrobacter pratensis]|uniref:hypothetical protein n=1 Tax=Candidatus Solirubrobacter pratensis TaxID=1298857 RepID=UPI0012DDF15F|nr:hypothetical protein [Candidatus Solirubrobacter pratensis]